MYAYISLVIVILTATQAYPTPSFKLLETYTGLSEINGSTQSCTYTKDTHGWVLFDRWRNAAYKIPATYPNKITAFNLENIDLNLAEYSASQSAVFLSSALKIWFASKEGSVREWDLNFETTLSQDTITIGTVGINGVCNDPDTDFIYVTAPGMNNDRTYTNNDAGIWKVNVETNTFVRVYNGGTDTVQDQNDNMFTESDGSTAYRFHPNACTVKDGVVYFIETRADASGVLGVLTAGTDILSIIGDKLTDSGTSIDVIGDYLIVATADSLLYYDTSDVVAIFNVGMAGLQSPGDFSVGPYNTLCVPSLTSGDIHFIRFSSRPFLNRLSRNFTMYTLDPITGSMSRDAMSTNIVWDPKRRKFAYINQHTANPSNKPDLNEISSRWPVDTSITDVGFVGADFLRETVIPERQTSGGVDTMAFYQLGTIANDIFYGTDGWGILFAQDLTTENVINYIDTVADYALNFANKVASLSSVCIDPDNSNMAYVMDGYNGYMWQVDVSAEDWVLNEIYSHENITDQNGLFPRKFFPFDCTVMDGNVYMVETSGVGSLGIYNIGSGVFIYNSDVLDKRASSIASSAGVIILTTLDYAYMSDNEKGVGFGLYVPGEMDTVEIQYYMYVDTSNGNTFGYPLQLAIDSFNGVVAYTYHIIANEGAISFMQSDEFMVPTTASPTTVEPSNTPTLAPSPSSTSTTKTSKASDRVCNMVFITLLIGLFCSK